MRCEHCQGSGWIRTEQQLETETDTNAKAYYSGPCQECHGIGIVSCCEGSERHGQLEDVVGEVIICQGEPRCELKGDAAHKATMDGCPWCERIHVLADGSQRTVSKTHEC